MNVLFGSSVYRGVSLAPARLSARTPLLALGGVVALLLGTLGCGSGGGSPALGSASGSSSGGGGDSSAGSPAAAASGGGTGSVTTAGAPAAGNGGSAGATASGGAPSGGASTGGAGNAGAGGGSFDPSQRKLLLRDEGNNAVHYVDLANIANNWHQSVPPGRDLQLIGGRKFLIGTDDGYQERSLDDGSVVKTVSSYPGTLAAHRLHNGNTLLSGVAFHGGQGIELVELTAEGSVARTIEYAGDYVRMVRESRQDHFLLTANERVFEGDAQGNVLWQVAVQGSDMPHAWEALPRPGGDVLISSGYGASLQIFGADEQLKQTITGDDTVLPNFFADVQVMPTGNYVVINWQGHGPGRGNTGVQLLEYNPEGELVWFWKQDASFVSSLHSVIVLDGLDLEKLQVESPEHGMLEPAN